MPRTHAEHLGQRTAASATCPVVCTRSDDGVAILHLGTSESDSLDRAFFAALEAALDRLEEDGELRGVILTGAQRGMFAAGADLAALQDLTDAGAGEAAASHARQLFDRIASLHAPVVAAIEGPCLGAGLELALACRARVVSEARSTRLGLPDVRLGIVPRCGGTQRLPRLIGLPGAVDLIVRGRWIGAEESVRIGLADRQAPGARLLEVARHELEAQMASRGRSGHRRPWPLATRLLSSTAIGRAFVRRRAQRELQDGSGRFYPALERALHLCVDALACAPTAGFARESRAFGELVATPVAQALVRMSIAAERQRRLGVSGLAADVESAVVLGAGPTGAGIAGLLVRNGIRVRLCDVDGAALAAAEARLATSLAERVRQRDLLPGEAQAQQGRLTLGRGEWGRLECCDVLLEAVVEDLTVKQKVLAEAVARGLPAGAVIASSTSSLSVDELAKPIPAPHRVVGMHFSCALDRMPLVEVVRGRQTSDRAIATACRLATQLGKVPIVVRDGPGFLVNRCLAPYFRQAERLLLAGTSPEAIDRVMLEFGMPVGPCRLLDEIGFDVAGQVARSLERAFGPRARPGPLIPALLAASVLGRRSGGGLYEEAGIGAGPGRAVLRGLCGRRSTTLPHAEVRARLLYPMVDEAYRCLAEQVVASEAELDLGLTLGIGFPPFLGGVTGFAAGEGLARIVDKLDELGRSIDPGLTASDTLRRRAATCSRA